MQQKNFRLDIKVLNLKKIRVKPIALLKESNPTKFF